MKTFKADELDDMVRHVIKIGNCMIQEHETGNVLTVLEEFDKADKETVVRDFCTRRKGPFDIYSK
jgi:hypothetical protein